MSKLFKVNLIPDSNKFIGTVAINEKLVKDFSESAVSRTDVNYENPFGKLVISNPGSYVSTNVSVGDLPSKVTVLAETINDRTFNKSVTITSDDIIMLVPEKESIVDSGKTLIYVKKGNEIEKILSSSTLNAIVAMTVSTPSVGGYTPLPAITLANPTLLTELDNISRVGLMNGAPVTVMNYHDQIVLFEYVLSTDSFKRLDNYVAKMFVRVNQSTNLWEIGENASHLPSGTISITSTVGGNGGVVNVVNDSQKVVIGLIKADETYSKHGITAGTSEGTTSCSFDVHYNGGIKGELRSPSSGVCTFTPYNGMFVAGDFTPSITGTDTLVLTHPPILDSSTDVPLSIPFGGSSYYNRRDGASTANIARIQFKKDDGGVPTLSQLTLARVKLAIPGMVAPTNTQLARISAGANFWVYIERAVRL